MFFDQAFDHARSYLNDTLRQISGEMNAEFEYELTPREAHGNHATLQLRVLHGKGPAERIGLIERLRARIAAEKKNPLTVSVDVYLDKDHAAVGEVHMAYNAPVLSVAEDAPE